MTTTSQPPTTPLTPNPPPAGAQINRAVLNAGIRANAQTKWIAGFSQDRALFHQAGIDAEPIDVVMQDTFDIVWACNEVLTRSTLDVLDGLISDYRATSARTAAQRDRITAIYTRFQELSRDPIRLARLPGGAATVAPWLFQIEQAYTPLLDIHRGVANDLDRVVRRAKRRRLFFESVHTIAVLLLFTFLFDAIADRTCAWIHEAFGVVISDSSCHFMKIVATVLLFAAERAGLGSRVDSFIAKYAERAAADACNQFYYRTTRALYLTAYTEETALRAEDQLKQHNIIV